MTPFPSRRQQRGFSLVEIAIVLGVVSLIIGGIWAAASSTQSSARIGDAQTAVFYIAGNIQALGAGMSSLANLGTAGTPGTNITTPMIAAGAFPTNTIKSPTQAVDPWLGAYRVNIGRSLMTFQLFMDAVPPDDCIKLIHSFTNYASLTGIYTSAGWESPATPTFSCANTFAGPAGTKQFGLEFTLRARP